jgi:antitoxin CptB
MPPRDFALRGSMTPSTDPGRIEPTGGDLDTRRRRAAYRAAHRGTKEMDFMVGRYAEAILPTLDDPALARFEQFLSLPDPELQGWLLKPERIAGLAFEDLIADVRKFHGL